MLCDRQICPRGRYKGTGTIGQYKRQMKFAASMTPAKHIKRRSLKGMARPNDGYLIGKVVEMMSAVALAAGCPETCDVRMGAADLSGGTAAMDRRRLIPTALIIDSRPCSGGD